MKWLKKNWSFCIPWFFSLLKKKKASSALSFFSSWTFFFYYLFVYSTAVVFLIRQVLCFCLRLVLAIRVLSLKRSAIGPAKHLRNQRAGCYCSSRPLPRVEEEGGERKGGGKHCWQAHTGHSWQGTARCWEYLSRSHWWIVGDWRHTSGCCIRVYVFY